MYMMLHAALRTYVRTRARARRVCVCVYVCVRVCVCVAIYVRLIALVRRIASRRIVCVRTFNIIIV